MSFVIDRCHMRNSVVALLLVVGIPIVATAQAPAPTASRTSVIMLGTGNPTLDPDRMGPATVVLVDSTAYLIDAGVGVVRRWAAAGRGGLTTLQPWQLHRLFVTHLHTDHTLGFAELIFSSWTVAPEPRVPLQVFGPRGTRAMADHLLAAYVEDIRVRTGTGGESEGASPPRVDVNEITPGVVYRDSLVTVTAFAVHHGTFSQAFGYRFQTPDRDIVISGDAAPPSAIAAQCHGCDILIHEGGFYHTGSANAYRRQFHTSMEELLDVARASRPKLLVLYHQTRGNNEAGRQFIQAGFDGRVVVANDLDVFR
jgi:ribonuclease BN (tRNA processing enzyme)